MWVKKKNHPECGIKNHRTEYPWLTTCRCLLYFSSLLCTGIDCTNIRKPLKTADCWTSYRHLHFHCATFLFLRTNVFIWVFVLSRRWDLEFARMYEWFLFQVWIPSSRIFWWAYLAKNTWSNSNWRGLLLTWSWWSASKLESVLPAALETRHLTYSRLLHSLNTTADSKEKRYIFITGKYTYSSLKSVSLLAVTDNKYVG